MCLDFVRTSLPPPEGIHGRTKAVELEEDEEPAEGEAVPTTKPDSYIKATSRSIARLLPLGGDVVRLFHSARNERVALPMGENETIDHLCAPGAPAKPSAEEEEEDGLGASHRDESSGMMWIDLSIEEAEAVETVLLEYPEPVAVDELPLDSAEEQKRIADLLLREGIVQLAKRPKKKTEH